MDDRIIDQLQDLPPDLPEPGDRFEQVRERVRRTRRRQTVVGSVAGAAVLALTVPLAAQLLPETAEVGPGVGVPGTTTATATGTTAPSTPVTGTSEPLPGGTRVTHLSEPITMNGTGNATVDLGEKPTGVTGVGMVLDCLSAGDFTYPDGSGLLCEDVDAGTELTDPEDFEELAYVVSLAKGSEEVEIRATEGSSWRLMASYVSTEVTDWGVNAKGETYGVENIHGSPDLVSVSTTEGQFGYAYVADMNTAWPEPTSPEHALEMQEERAGEGVSVPVYESDGETLIGEFIIGASTGGESEVSTATATMPSGQPSTAIPTTAP